MMPHPLRWAPLALVLAACSTDSHVQSSRRGGSSDSVSQAAGTIETNGAAPASAVPGDSILEPPAPLVPKPDPMRGLYVNRWAALGRKVWELVGVAKTTEVNALVIDVKDDRGLLLYRSRVPLARRIGADTLQPMSAARVRALLDTMRVHGIYPIARIVVAKDPLLAAARPEWAIRRRDDPTKPWLDKNGRPWLDPHHAGVWQYAADLAREAVALGFSEVQLDYVRFPDERRLVRETVFPLARGRTRAQVIREQLGFTRKQINKLGVPMSIDVFGLTTSDTTDMGIGQLWEMFVDQADEVLPMTYPSHYAPGSYGIATPNANPYEVIDRALEDAKRRSAKVPGAAPVTPWYQDFTLGPPRYGVAQLRAQMRAGYDNGIRSWILWNPGSRYTVAALEREEGAMGPARTPPAAPVARDSARPAADVPATKRDTTGVGAPAVRKDTVISPPASRDSAARRDSAAKRDSARRDGTPTRDTSAKRDSSAKQDSAVRRDSAPRSDSTGRQKPAGPSDSTARRDSLASPDGSAARRPATGGDSAGARRPLTGAGSPAGADTLARPGGTGGEKAPAAPERAAAGDSAARRPGAAPDTTGPGAPARPAEAPATPSGPRKR